DEIASAWFHVAGEGSGQAAPAQVWLPTVVDALHDPGALLSPVYDEGQLVDFRVEYANALARQVFTGARVDADEATLLAAYPAAAHTVGSCGTRGAAARPSSSGCSTPAATPPPCRSTSSPPPCTPTTCSACRTRCAARSSRASSCSPRSAGPAGSTAAGCA